MEEERRRRATSSGPSGHLHAERIDSRSALSTHAVAATARAALTTTSASREGFIDAQHEHDGSDVDPNNGTDDDNDARNEGYRGEDSMDGNDGEDGKHSRSSATSAPDVAGAQDIDVEGNGYRATTAMDSARPRPGRSGAGLMWESARMSG